MKCISIRLIFTPMLTEKKKYQSQKINQEIDAELL